MKILPPPHRVVVIYSGRALAAVERLEHERRCIRAGSKVVYSSLSQPDAVMLGSFSHSVATGQPWPQVAA